MKDLNYISIEENERRRDYYEFCKAFDALMTEEDEDDGFTGDIAKSSRTDTNKDEIDEGD